MDTGVQSKSQLEVPVSSPTRQILCIYEPQDTMVCTYFKSLHLSYGNEIFGSPTVTKDGTSNCVYDVTQKKSSDWGGCSIPDIESTGSVVSGRLDTKRGPGEFD